VKNWQLPAMEWVARELPEKRNPIAYFGNGPGAQRVVVAWRIFAMLVFYLSIIIFEAIMESQTNKGKAGACANSD
jgi:hypothetical protein